MPLYLIAYDTNAPGQDDEQLRRELHELGARRVMKPAWTLRSEHTPSALIERLKPYVIDASGRILVAEVNENA